MLNFGVKQLAGGPSNNLAREHGSRGQTGRSPISTFRETGERSVCPRFSVRRSRRLFCEFLDHVTCFLKEFWILCVLVQKKPLHKAIRVFARGVLSLIRKHRIIINFVDAADALKIMAANHKFTGENITKPFQQFLLPVGTQLVGLHDA